MAENIKFKYIHSNTWKKEHDYEDNLVKDGFEVLYDEYIYSRNKKNLKARSNRWVCKFTGCKASLTIDYDRVITKFNHDHLNNHAKVNVQKEIFEKKLKERCSTEDKGVIQIYEEEINELFKGLVTDEEKKKASLALPEIDKIRFRLQKRKNKLRPILPESLKTTIVNGIYTKTANNIDQFLIYKSRNNSKLVFCSKIGLEILSKSSDWHADGTFHVATKFYYQLYVIQAYFKKRMIPCV